MEISKEYALHFLSYNPITGKFYWIRSRGHFAKKGQEAGSVNPAGYRNICLDGVMYPASHLACLFVTGKLPRFTMDHKNRVRDDNSWNNLREASQHLQIINSGIRKDNSSGIKGVSFIRKLEKWCAYITVNKKSCILGYSRDLLECACLRFAAEQLYYPSGWDLSSSAADFLKKNDLLCDYISAM